MKKPDAPSRSWWQDAPPDRFTKLAEQEAPRMRVSTFGRIIGTQLQGIEQVRKYVQHKETCLKYPKRMWGGITLCEGERCICGLDDLLLTLSHGRATP
jgi:hypothetical protein